MSYPLQQTHDVLHKCFGENGIFTGTFGCSDDFIPVWSEMQNFQSLFLRLAASAPSVEALRILVEVTATGCIDSLDKVKFLEQQAGSVAGVQSVLSRLTSSLEEILCWIRTRFGRYFNEDMALPGSLAEKERENICHVLFGIREEATVPGCEEWLTIVSDLVKEIFERKGPPLSCRLVSYMGNLLTSLRDTRISESVDASALNVCAQLFIRCNCNHTAVIQRISRELSNEANNILSPAGRIEKWQWFRKEIGQMVECGTALHPGAGSVKASLLSFIDGELAWLGQKENSLALVYGSRVSSTAGSFVFTPLLTTLSVSQLAVWCRLLFDCGILKHDNQTELLKTVAGALQTTRAANISADSLRAKYYSPDRSALAIVKEQLFRMVNLIKEI